MLNFNKLINFFRFYLLEKGFIHIISRKKKFELSLHYDLTIFTISSVHQEAAFFVLSFSSWSSRS